MITQKKTLDTKDFDHSCKKTAKGYRKEEIQLIILFRYEMAGGPLGSLELFFSFENIFEIGIDIVCFVL